MYFFKLLLSFNNKKNTVSYLIRNLTFWNKNKPGLMLHVSIVFRISNSEGWGFFYDHYTRSEKRKKNIYYVTVVFCIISYCFWTLVRYPMLSPTYLSLIDSSLDRWESDKELHAFILIPYTDLETRFYALEILVEYYSFLKKEI